MDNLYIIVIFLLISYIAFRIFRTIKLNSDPLNIEMMKYFAEGRDWVEDEGQEILQLAFAVERSGGLSYRKRLLHVATMIKSNHSYNAQQKDNAITLIRLLYTSS